MTVVGFQGGSEQGSDVSTLEAHLRLSVIQGELLKIADMMTPHGARIVRYAARVLDLLRST